MAKKADPVAIGFGILTGFLVLKVFFGDSPKQNQPTPTKKEKKALCIDGCECVLTTHQAHCDAIQRLIRPEEVKHLVPHLYPSQVVRLTGQWFQKHFTSGVFSYQADPKGCDLWCPPSETLAKKTGDCDDWAILVCSILHSKGISADVVVGDLYQNGKSGGHAWVEGEDTSGPFLFEATTGEVIRGKRPKDYAPKAFLRPGSCRVV